MWYSDFADRLESWHELRVAADSRPLPEALDLIAQWWDNTPWQPYFLHWDDQPKWPDPWQLLDDNVFCEVARGLGILYTISMLNHDEIASADLVLTEDGRNLVLINKELYILNWESGTVVNTHQAVKVKKKLTQEQVKKQYK